MSSESNYEFSMEDLLESWKVGTLNERLKGVSRNLYSKTNFQPTFNQLYLKEYGFDVHSLENIDEDDLSKIFPENHFYGSVKRFLSSQLDWLKSKKCEVM